MNLTSEQNPSYLEAWSEYQKRIDGSILKYACIEPHLYVVLLIDDYGYRWDIYNASTMGVEYQCHFKDDYIKAKQSWLEKINQYAQ